MAQKKTKLMISEKGMITEHDVLIDLDGLPEPKLHCARLAIDALRKSIESYRK